MTFTTDLSYGSAPSPSDGRAMSTLLDNLLDPVRLEQCRTADAAASDEALAHTMHIALRPAIQRNKAETLAHYSAEARAAVADLLPPARVEPVETPAIWRACEDDMLADVDSYTEWLAAECMGHADVRTGYVPSDADELAALLETLTVPQLAAHRGYPSADVCFGAEQELQRRYLATANVQTVLQFAVSEAA